MNAHVDPRTTTSLVPIVRVAGNRVVASSQDVADYFGRQHAHVLRAIDKLRGGDLSKIGSMFWDGHTLDAYYREQRIVDMTRDGFTLLAMGFTGAKALKFKLAYIAEFNAMEAELKAGQERFHPGPLIAALAKINRDLEELKAVLWPA